LGFIAFSVHFSLGDCPNKTYTPCCERTRSRQPPSDPQLLREMVLALSAQLEEHERRLQRVQHIMEQLLAWRFGARRERVVDERQLFLFAVEFEAQGGDIDRLTEELSPE